jgi:TRAP-type C4-dicarboxylate transport system permease small subunit
MRRAGLLSGIGAEPHGMIKAFLGITHFARNALRVFSVLLLAFYLSLILLQVFYRYVLNDSLFW